MGILRPKSFRTLTLTGSLLACAPLVVAIVLTAAELGSLSQASAETVQGSADATRDVQLLRDILTTLERNARQYEVLGDAELLELIDSRHQRLSTLLEAMRGRSAAVDELADGLAVETNVVLQALRETPHDSDRVTSAVAEFARLHAMAQTLHDALNASIDDALADLDAQATQIRRTLHIQAAALIPLAALIAILFSHYISTPVRQLGKAVRRLGDGKLAQPIEIGGPRDISMLGRRLDWLRRRLHTLEQDKQTFLRQVSHELKTPLSSIREGAEILVDGDAGPLSTSQSEITGIMLGNALTLQQHIENLLAFNTWQDQQARLDYEPVDLAELLDGILLQHRIPVMRNGLVIEKRLQVQSLHADRAKLRLMLDNLLSNAVKMSPVGGRLRVASRNKDGWVVLSVSDDGPGVPAGDKDKLFDAFYQGTHDGHQRPKGTGIGLSVVRECARMHGGTVRVGDGELDGATIEIRLPSTGGINEGE